MKRSFTAVVQDAEKTEWARGVKMRFAVGIILTALSVGLLMVAFTCSNDVPGPQMRQIVILAAIGIIGAILMINRECPK